MGHILISEHSTGTTPPAITGQPLQDIFISKDKEKAQKIKEKATEDYRKEHNMPDTEGLLEMRLDWEKRKRSDTVSTVSLDNPLSKAP